MGNVMAGKLLSINAKRSIILMPFALLVSYICLFIVGEWIGAMVIVILILGVLAGIASNNMQYMIADAAPRLCQWNVSDFSQFRNDDWYSYMRSFYYRDGHTIFCFRLVVFPDCEYCIRLSAGSRSAYPEAG